MATEHDAASSAGKIVGIALAAMAYVLILYPIALKL